MNKSTDLLTNFFTVFLKGQTYLNIVYVLLSFPLGLFYFVFLVTGLSVGLSLVIVWIGLLILPAVALAWWGMAAFERQMAIWLLRVDIAPMNRPGRLVQAGVWPQIKAHLSNPVTWKSLAYLFIKFPIGIVCFVISTALFAVSGIFLAAPLTYRWFPIDIMFTGESYWRVDTLSEALVLCVIGLGLALISMHAMNGLAWLSGWFARVMLGIDMAGHRPASEPADQTVQPDSQPGSEQVNI